MLNREEVFKRTDYIDEELTEKELQGERVEEWVVEIVTDEGVEFVPTAVGLKVLSQELTEKKDKSVGGKISIVNCQVYFHETQKGESFVVATATARNGFGVSWVGSSIQPIYINGQYDPFCVPKATTKAQRNALRGLIPERIIQDFIKRALREGKIRRESLKPTETIEEEEIPVIEDEKITPHDEDALWKEVYRAARRRYGDDFKRYLDDLIYTMFGKKRGLTLSELIRLKNILEGKGG